MSIVLVEFPKPKAPTPQKPVALTDVFPLPWSAGEQHESKCEIMAANGNRVLTLSGNAFGFNGEIATRILQAVNAMAPKVEKKAPV